MDRLLVILRTISPLIALASGISGIIGQSLDPKGHITYYGWITLSFLVASSIASVITTIIEQGREKEKELAELNLINQNIKSQSKILEELSRNFYKIETIDFSIEYFVSADHPLFARYKVQLDDFINQWLDNNCPALEKGISIIKAGNEPNNGHPVYSMSIRPYASLAPTNSNGNSEHLLTQIKSDILIGEKTDFSLLNHTDLNPPIPSLYLHHLCDFKLFAYSPFEQKDDSAQECIVSYQPGKGVFKLLSRKKNAVITFNNGKVLSYKDVIGRHLTIFIDSWYTEVIGDIRLGEVRVNFNRSQATDYSSWIELRGSEMTRLEGKHWQAYTYLIPSSLQA